MWLWIFRIIVSNYDIRFQAKSMTKLRRNDIIDHILEGFSLADIEYKDIRLIHIVGSVSHPLII